MGCYVKEDNNQLRWIDSGYQNKKGMIDRPVPKFTGEWVHSLTQAHPTCSVLYRLTAIYSKIKWVVPIHFGYLSFIPFCT